MKDKFWESLKLLTPRLWLFLGTMILANIAAQMIFPLESLYVKELGASIEQIGLYATITMIAPLALQILGGWISDSTGRLQAIAIGSIAGTLSYGFYIFAPSWQWLIPSSVLTAMAVAFVAPSFQAFIAEESSPETRGRVFGVTSMIYGIVNIVGPLLGGITVEVGNFRTMYIVAAAFYASAAVIRILMARKAKQPTPETATAEKRSRNKGFWSSMKAVFALILGGGIVSWIFISDGIRDVSFRMTMSLLPIYFETEMGLSVFQISVLSSITAIVATALMFPAGWLADKKGERVTIVAGFGLIAVGWGVFLLSTNFWQFIFSRIFIGIGWALIDPAYSSLISKAVPEKLRGVAYGLFSTSMGLISLPAPLLGTLLWENFSPRVPFFVPLVGMLLTLPIMWYKFKLPEETEPTASTEESIPLLEPAENSPTS